MEYIHYSKSVCGLMSTHIFVLILISSLYILLNLDFGSLLNYLDNNPYLQIDDHL